MGSSYAPPRCSKVPSRSSHLAPKCGYFGKGLEALRQFWGDALFLVETNHEFHLYAVVCVRKSRYALTGFSATSEHPWYKRGDCSSLFLKKTYSFCSFIDFSEDASPPTERPPLRLVLKTEGSSDYGNEYTSSLPLTPDSTREILSVINRSWKNDNKLCKVWRRPSEELLQRIIHV